VCGYPLLLMELVSLLKDRGAEPFFQATRHRSGISIVA